MDSPFIRASIVEKAAMPSEATPKAVAVEAGFIALSRHPGESRDPRTSARPGRKRHCSWIPDQVRDDVDASFRGVGDGVGSAGFDLGRLGFDELDDVVDHLVVADMVVGDAGDRKSVESGKRWSVRVDSG